MYEWDQGAKGSDEEIRIPDTSVRGDAYERVFSLRSHSKEKVKFEFPEVHALLPEGEEDYSPLFCLDKASSLLLCFSLDRGLFWFWSPKTQYATIAVPMSTTPTLSAALSTLSRPSRPARGFIPHLLLICSTGFSGKNAPRRAPIEFGFLLGLCRKSMLKEFASFKSM